MVTCCLCFIGSLETGTLDPAFRNSSATALKVDGSPPDALLPGTTPSPSLGKEGGQFSSPHLFKDDEWKESNGRVYSKLLLLIREFDGVIYMHLRI